MPLDLSILNPEQRLAVEEIEGPCMIIAGAGSGKTRVLTYKIAHLIESGISPFEILSLTFTNKAAAEMKERINVLVEHGGANLWMGTFHSIFARLLRIEADKLGYNRNFSIYDSDDSISVVKQIMIAEGISTENPTPKGVHAFISNLKNKLIYPDTFETNARSTFERLVSVVYKEYLKVMFRNNAMDFDDLLMKPIELFEKFPDVLERYQEKFKFILVDEYQDTNRAQYLIVKMLSEKYKNISVVGDDAQSIYKWRGAEIQNIFDFQEDFPEIKIFRLEQNYRSTQKILSLADDVIKRNKKQITKNLWTERTEGENVHLLETMTDKDEAYRVTRYITEEMQKNKVNFKDFVILYRTNAQSRTLEEYLRHHSMPYEIVGGVRFYQRKEIKDVLANFKIIVNPNDNEALTRVLNLKEGIGKTTIEKICKIAEIERKQLFEVLKTISNYAEFSSKTKNMLAAMNNYIFKYQYLKEEISLSELARGIIDEMGIIPSLKAENTFEAEERLNNIQELLSAVAEFNDSAENPTLESFLQEVSLVADIDWMDDKKNAVTLMTIHASKGLEFPVVFITGLEEGIFPGSQASLEESELEEERRLFYVAITRAKEKLYLSFANQRYRFGTQSYQMKSRFVKEISDELLKTSFTVESIKLPPQRTASERSSSSSQGTFIKYDYYNTNLNSSKKKPEKIEEDKFPDIQKGVTVNHNTFGKGTVMSITGKGLDKKAEIYFDDLGMRKIVLKYAKMTVMDFDAGA